MTKFRLSICIATLNRATFLRETLASILPQCPDDVEIAIVDGASTDGTEDLVRSYQASYPNISYLRLPEKGGVDRDYWRAVELARGEYCWLMSDDDVLKPGAVAAVLNAIAQEYVVVVVNAEVRDADLSRLIGERMLPFSVDQRYPPGADEQFFSAVGSYTSFIGCVVVSRQFWEQRAKEPYLGTEFIHVGVLFQARINGPTAIIAEPLIIIRYNNASWSSRYFEIWMFKWPRLIWSFKHYSPSALRNVSLHEPWRNYKLLLINRARGTYNKSEYERFLAPLLPFGWQRFVTAAISIAPGWLVNMSVYGYFRVFKPGDILVCEDLRISKYHWSSLRSPERAK